MWQLGILILCEGLAGAVLAYSLRLGNHTEEGEENAGHVVGWVVAIIALTLFGYGVMKSSVLGI